MEFDRRIGAITFLIGVVSLMYELIQVRMLAFFLGNSMDIIAIPIALLGLAVGSMFRHFLWKGESQVLIDRLCQAVFPMMLLSFLVFFGVANTFFNLIHVALATPPGEAAKVVIYSLIFLPPYVAFGALFSTLFSEFSDRIGRLYFFDLAGAGLGCVLTPLMLTWLGLPPAILLVLLLSLGLLALPRSTPVPAQAGGLVAWVVALGLALGGIAFHERPDPDMLSRSILKAYRDGGVSEVDSRWNEIARTALMRAGPVENKHGPVWAVVQDNGLSNVTIHPFREEFRDDAVEHFFHYSFAFRLGMDPKSVLVMFAGMGRDMVHFYELTKGQAQITGVEINRTVVAWHAHPALAHMNLVEFHDKPNVDLRNQEGRDFLNTDDQTFDLIYVANNGAVHASRTGHTRKYLDTYEAMAAYIDKLSPDGLMVFTAQPVMEKIPSFRKIFKDKGYVPFDQAVYIFGPNHPMLDSMVVKPSGFTPEDIRILDAQVTSRPNEKILYKPGSRGFPRFQTLLDTPLEQLEITTDDKPFTARVEWEKWTLFPDPERYHDAPYVSGWVKVFTVLLFAIVSGIVAVLAAVLGTREQRVPAVWVGYLLLTGVGYMCVEIPLIAKTELFIGNPLYAVSINLATFLVFNAIGSYLQDEFKIMRGAASLAVGVVFAVLWGVGLATFMTSTLLSVALPLKAIGVALIVLPAGVVLGTFYPYCVSKLVAGDQGATVPMTYGLTTLSSVLGSAFAMAAIINLGFTNVMILGTVLYIGAAGVSLAYRR
ncbi:MAG: hypothetical protein H6737_17590 [Alphaproteobacteria bacterium]|nr:hypothetical protein [Alphaproteobacteria bacterium]